MIKLPFADGGFPNYPRPYLVVNSSNEYLYLLNVSSSHKKEWKLNIPSNKSIDKRYHYPPFKRPSFVKMDFVYQIPNKNYILKYLMDNGSTLHNHALQDILQSLKSYAEKNLYKINH